VRDGDRYVITANDDVFEAKHVVVAMASYQKAKVPAFAKELSPEIVQLHSSAYRNLGQLAPGPVLLVGAGNSGAEIALETARGGHRTWMAGRDVGYVPFRIAALPARLGLMRFVLRVLFHRIFTTSTPIGRKVRPKMISQGGPLVRTKPKDLERAGVERVTRIAGVRDGRPLLDDGRVLDAANVIWCTGFDPGFRWIRRPVFDAQGEPIQQRGVVPGEPGLYFIGLHFLYSYSSPMIHGVGRDAEYVAARIAERRRRAQTVRESRPALVPA
jgi:putative flavoprotein involved in K+ transport